MTRRVTYISDVPSGANEHIRMSMAMLLMMTMIRRGFEANAHYFKRKLDEELRRSAALRGQITKLKKRLAVAQMQAFGGDPRSVAFKQDGNVDP